MPSTLYDVQADGKQWVLISGSFTGAGAADPTYPISNPPGWTATRVAEGHYRITFADEYAALISANANFQASTPVDVAGYTAVFDDLSSGVMDVWVYNASDVADDLEVLEHLHFLVVFRKTSVTP